MLAAAMPGLVLHDVRFDVELAGHRPSKRWVQCGKAEIMIIPQGVNLRQTKQHGRQLLSTTPSCSLVLHLPSRQPIS
jgi:hypothetical protein